MADRYFASAEIPDEGGEIMAMQPLQDKDYDLISVIYHASQGYETCRTYSEDAKNAGDNDAARFFEEVMNQNEQLVQKGKQILKDRLQ